jgi:hypothetical protein
MVQQFTDKYEYFLNAGSSMRAPGAAVDACSGRPVPAAEQDGVVLL